MEFDVKDIVRSDKILYNEVYDKVRKNVLDGKLRYDDDLF